MFLFTLMLDLVNEITNLYGHEQDARASRGKGNAIGVLSFEVSLLGLVGGGLYKFIFFWFLI